MYYCFRLFSCGTSKEGDAHLVEWNESEGAIKREYSGFGKRAMGVVQFDTTRNRVLAAGDEFQIKFWDMNDAHILAATDADERLHVSMAYKNILISLIKRLIIILMFICIRQGLNCGLTRKGHYWQSPQVTMELEYWQIMMGSEC